MKTITLNVELNDQQAYQFAQFLKRVSWHDYRELSTSDQRRRGAHHGRGWSATHSGYAPR